MPESGAGGDENVVVLDDGGGGEEGAVFAVGAGDVVFLEFDDAVGLEVPARGLASMWCRDVRGGVDWIVMERRRM